MRNGKGDKRQPMEISAQQWAARWEAIFGPQPEATTKTIDPLRGCHGTKADEAAEKPSQNDVMSL